MVTCTSDGRKCGAAMRFLYPIVLVLSLSACAGTVTVPQVERGSAPAFDTATHGVILSSSSFSGKYPDGARIPVAADENHRCNSYAMFYRYLEQSDERIAGQLSAIPNGNNRWTPNDPHDYAVHEGLGFVAATLLPAGRYEVYFFSSVCGVVQSTAEEAFSVPFEIKPGVATYVGEIVYTHRFFDNFGGITQPFSPGIRFSMAPKRDLPLLESRYPFLSEFTLEIVELPWHEMNPP